MANDKSLKTTNLNFGTKSETFVNSESPVYILVTVPVVVV